MRKCQNMGGKPMFGVSWLKTLLVIYYNKSQKIHSVMESTRIISEQLSYFNDHRFKQKERLHMKKSNIDYVGNKMSYDKISWLIPQKKRKLTELIWEVPFGGLNFFLYTHTIQIFSILYFSPLVYLNNNLSYQDKLCNIK